MFGRDKSAKQTTASSTSSGSQVNGSTAPQSIPVVPTNSKIETVIGPSCRMNGKLHSEGGLRIDGIFDGSIHITGNLVVGESATVIADIVAYNITVSGTVKGNITANKIEIMETGKVWGDLNVNTLLLNEGAFLRGNTNMQGDVEPPALEPPEMDLPKLGLPAPENEDDAE